MTVEGRREGLTTADLVADTERTNSEPEMERGEGKQAEMPVPPRADGAATTVGARPASADSTPLFPTPEAEELRSRWQTVQVGFVDEPRRAVEQADGMVAEMMKRLAQVFADERGKLEEQWSRGDDISTEDLRVALQRYRSFFDRLLSV